jgi:hypothetical protein
MKLRTITFKQTMRFAFAGLMALSLLSSCKKDDPYDFEDTIAANVNLINTNATAGPVALYVDNIVRTSAGVAYGEASGYKKTFLGDQDVDIRLAGGAQTTLASSHSQFDANESYTFFLVTEGSGSGMITIKDDATASASGKAKVRFVNASPGANITASVSGILLTGTAAQGFKFVSEVFEIPAGQSTLAIRSGSTTASLSRTWESGRSYTVYTSGVFGGTGVNAFRADVFTNK